MSDQSARALDIRAPLRQGPRPSSIPSDLAADAAEFREPAFRDALVAGVAMVAHVDGAASPAERSRFLSLPEEDPALRTFDRAAVLDALAAPRATTASMSRLGP